MYVCMDIGQFPSCSVGHSLILIPVSSVGIGVDENYESGHVLSRSCDVYLRHQYQNDEERNTEKQYNNSNLDDKWNIVQNRASISSIFDTLQNHVRVVCLLPGEIYISLSHFGMSTSTSTSPYQHHPLQSPSQRNQHLHGIMNYGPPHTHQPLDHDFYESSSRILPGQRRQLVQTRARCHRNNQR